MLPTDRQISYAYRIDQYVQDIEKRGGGDAEILQNTYDYMAPFKYILDTSQDGQIDMLCEQFDGFYRFAQLLELMAAAIRDDAIEVPDIDLDDLPPSPHL